MKSTLITMDKKYRYRSGLPARILCIDGHIRQPVVSMTGTGGVHTHCEDGRYLVYTGGHEYDLIEVKPRFKRKLWINIYENFINIMHETKEKADAFAFHNRIACVKIDIDVEEGEGL